MNRRQIRMRVELDVEVIGDGCIGLRWRADAAVERTTLMIMRSGAVPAYTSLQLSGDLETYQIEHLSRHQRYRFFESEAASVAADLARSTATSPAAGCWYPVNRSLTPPLSTICSMPAWQTFVQPVSPEGAPEKEKHHESISHPPPERRCRSRTGAVHLLRRTD